MRAEERGAGEDQVWLDVKALSLYLIPSVVVLLLPEAWFGSWAWIQPWLAALYAAWCNYYFLSGFLSGFRLFIAWCLVPVALAPGIAAFFWI